MEYKVFDKTGLKSEETCHPDFVSAMVYALRKTNETMGDASEILIETGCNRASVSVDGEVLFSIYPVYGD